MTVESRRGLLIFAGVQPIYPRNKWADMPPDAKWSLEISLKGLAIEVLACFGEPGEVAANDQG